MRFRRGDEAREARRGRESREFRRVEGSGRGSSGSSVDGIDVDEVRGGGLLSRRTSRRGRRAGGVPSDDVGDAVAVASFHGVLDECALPGRAMRACRVHVYHGTADPFTSAEALERCERDLAERGATRVEVFAFEGARHAFTRPEKVKPEDIEAGFGYDENAARESWRACVSMLDEAFAECVRRARRRVEPRA